MQILVTDQKELFAAYVASKTNPDVSWGPFYAMGIVDTCKRAVVAGVVICDYNGANATAHIAIEPGVGRQLLKLIEGVMDYAFNQCKLKRLTVLASTRKPNVLKFVKHIGFEEEFVMKSAAPDGCDLHVLVMWPDKCRWLKRSP